MKRLVLGILLSAAVWAQAPNRAEVQLQAAVNKETVEGDLKGAIAMYRKVAAEHRGNRLVASRALLRMAEAQEKLGEVEARKAYEQIVREYGDQQPASIARARLASLDKNPVEAAARKLLSPTPEWWTGFPNPSSGDGRYLFAALNEGGNWSPGVIDLISGQHQRISNPMGRSVIDTGVVSSDHKMVAYTVQPSATKLELVVSSFDGSNARTVLASGFGSASGISWLYPLAFSPDNKELFVRFLREGPRAYHLGRVSIANGAMKVIRQFQGEQLSEARVSPDGAWIVFTYRAQPANSSADIHIIGSDGSSESVIVDHAAEDRWPVWTADGKGLLFVTNRRGTNDLMLARISGGKASGGLLTVRQDIGNAQLFGTTKGGGVVYSLATGSQKFLKAQWSARSGKFGPFEPLEESFIGQKYRPQLSPDEKQLAYVRWPDYARDRATIGVRDLTTGKERELHPALRAVQYVHWMPDMRQLLVVGRSHSNTIGDYLVDSVTGDTKVLPPDGETMGYVRGLNPVVLSPDGKTLYCPTGKGGKGAVFAKDLSTGAMKLLIEADGLANAPSISPDGRWFAYYDNGEKRVGRVVSTQDGTVRNLPEGISVSGWSKDSKSIYVFSDKDSRQKLSDGQYGLVLFQTPLDGGKLTPIHDPIRLKDTDSQQIVGSTMIYRDRGQRADLWILDKATASVRP